MTLTTRIPITPKARRIVTHHRIDMMHFRAGDGSRDPARKAIDRDDASFFGGSTAPPELPRPALAPLVDAGGKFVFVEASFLDFLPLLISRGPSMGTAIATGRSSRWVVAVSLHRIFLDSFLGSAARSAQSPRSRDSKGSDPKARAETNTTVVCWGTE